MHINVFNNNSNNNIVYSPAELRGQINIIMHKQTK